MYASHMPYTLRSPGPTLDPCTVAAVAFSAHSCTLSVILHLPGCLRQLLMRLLLKTASDGEWEAAPIWRAAQEAGDRTFMPCRGQWRQPPAIVWAVVSWYLELAQQQTRPVTTSQSRDGRQV